MSIQAESNIKEKIKSFLIVGETLDGVYSFKEYQWVNIATSAVLLGSSVFSTIQAIGGAGFWWILAGGFLLGSIYFGILYRVNITYAITKFRIIRLENDLISEWFFQSSRLIGFTDLHYEHIESITVGSGQVSMPRFYSSLIGILLGWILFTQNLVPEIETLLNLFGVLLIVSSMINIAFSLPFGGVRLYMKSISGETMTFPESKTPQDFVDELILNCRTFLSYGAQ